MNLPLGTFAWNMPLGTLLSGDQIVLNHTVLDHSVLNHFVRDHNVRDHSVLHLHHFRSFHCIAHCRKFCLW